MDTDVTPRRIEAGSYADDAVPRGGGTIRIRAIRPDDRARLPDHFAGMSAKAHPFHFFGHKRRPTAVDLAPNAELDLSRHVGLAATSCQKSQERFIGIACYVLTEVPSRAEMALAMLDKYRGGGMGPYLIRHLDRIAHESGITGFEADVRGDNKPDARDPAQERMHPSSRERRRDRLLYPAMPGTVRIVC